MKKICIILLALILTLISANTVFADADIEFDTGGGVDALNKYNPEDAWNGQKKITDEEFESTMKRLEAKKKKNKKKKFKGTSLKEEDNSEFLAETAEKSVLLLLPVTLMTNDGTAIPVGHYKVVGSKEKGKIYFDFYQAHYRIARVEGIETENDFGQPTVNFMQILPYDDDRIRIIYGSMDFNAYAFINVNNVEINPESN